MNKEVFFSSWFLMCKIIASFLWKTMRTIRWSQRHRWLNLNDLREQDQVHLQLQSHGHDLIWIKDQQMIPFENYRHKYFLTDLRIRKKSCIRRRRSCSLFSTTIGWNLSLKEEGVKRYILWRRKRMKHDFSPVSLFLFAAFSSFHTLFSLHLRLKDFIAKRSLRTVFSPFSQSRDLYCEWRRNIFTIVVDFEERDCLVSCYFLVTKSQTSSDSFFFRLWEEHLVANLFSLSMKWTRQVFHPQLDHTWREWILLPTHLLLHLQTVLSELVEDLFQFLWLSLEEELEPFIWTTLSPILPSLMQFQRYYKVTTGLLLLVNKRLLQQPNNGLMSRDQWMHSWFGLKLREGNWLNSILIFIMQN